MKTCIICGKTKEDNKFNIEHIILDSLGGKGKEDFLEDICIDCNSKLGATIDADFCNHEYIMFLRNKFKIKSKNGKIPNPFKNVEFQYADTGIPVTFETNPKTGDITSIRAKHNYRRNSDGTVLITGPRKGFENYAKSISKKEGLNYTVEEIQNKKQHFPVYTPRDPFIKITEDGKEEFLLKYFFPLALKMSFEFCYMILGAKYLNDPIAESVIIPFFRKCISKEDLLFDGIDAFLWFKEHNTRNGSVSLSLENRDSKIVVTVEVFGDMVAELYMSDNAEEYEIDKVYYLKS